MKKLIVILMCLLLVLSAAACSKTNAPAGGDIQDVTQAQDTAPAQQDDEVQAAPEEAGGTENAPSDVGLSAWLNTRTGKFYSQFIDGKMYMEYEMTMDGTTMTMITATSGGKTYSETRANGQSSGASIMDEEYVYAIDHASKMVIKMPLQASAQQMMNTMIEEGDVDPAQMIAGTRDIDGKTYDTEEWNVEGAKSIMCFDGDNLAYIIGEYDGTETVIKVIKTSGTVDESLFELPEGYEVISY